jgi:hypothetical protein
MNQLLTANVALLTLAVGGLTTAIDLAKSGQYIAAGIVIVVSILAFIGYEKLPPTTPNTPQNTPPTPPAPVTPVTPQ